MEDQVMPKRCGHLPGKTLISEKTCVQKSKPLAQPEKMKTS